ncbi:hypothetical protein [Deinococcus puniceus]|uniref:Uncharacterized protein n=1 Tax=Deinococcus puniceus TaxID=1182568 RepID=A0A172T9I7_9DEIO|nr:hypothetical protein [Deinococcus puniceus]ANE43614.1 hypothetical protein SU48_07345 [Deinococcus puniceus]
MFQPQFKQLLIRTTAAVLLSAACAASAAQTTIRFTVTVVGTCQIQAQDAAGVTLRCTKDFSPADPRTLPALLGQLPPQQLALVGAEAAAEGGTLNRYAFAAAANAEQQEQHSGVVAFY